jgi:hypothetical protein
VGFLTLLRTLHPAVLAAFLAIYLFLSWLYYRERRARILARERHRYRWAHSFEHAAVWLYLYLLNFHELDHGFVWTSLAVVVGLVVGLPVLVGAGFNLALLATWRRRVPSWLPPERLQDLAEKTRRNATSLKLYHYVQKPYNHELACTVVTWAKVESWIDQSEIEGRFDVVVGVRSGGALIADQVARRFAIPEVQMIHSRCWSGLSLRQTYGKVRGYFRSNGPTVLEELDVSTLDVEGKRVLSIRPRQTEVTPGAGVDESPRGRRDQPTDFRLGTVNCLR